MSPLSRKLLRDLRGMRGQAVAIMALVASGVGVFVATAATHQSLERSRLLYYERYRFADVFAPLRRAPESVVAEIAALPGVEAADGRVTGFANLSVPDFDEPITGRVQSLPEHGEPAINKLIVARGQIPDSSREDDVLVNDGFAKAHKLDIGARFQAILNGKRRELRVAGVAQSPEHIYPVRPGEFLPDDQHYAILWMNARALASSMQMTAAVNDVVVRLDGSQPAALVRDRIDRVLAPHGGLGSFGREDHDSHRFLSDDIRMLKNMATILPPIFFGVAAFLLSVVLSRIVALQRPEIGTLKALGYSNAAVGWHFGQLGLVLLAGGSVLGMLLGTLLGQSLTTVYAGFYRLPLLDFAVPPDVAAQAIGLCTVISALAVATHVGRAMRLPPAQAMRAEPPAVYHRTWIERWGLLDRMSPPLRMVVRHMLRRTRRSLLTSLGLGSALAIVLASLYFSDAIEFMTGLQFGLAQREDITVTFTDPLPREALHDLARLPGVRRVEGFRAVPAMLRAGPRWRRLGLLTVPERSELRQILTGEHALAVPDRGLVLSAALAEQLAVRAGDWLTVEVLEGRRRVLRLPVVFLAEDWMGVMAVLGEEALEESLGEPANLSGALLLADAGAEKQLYRQLKQQPRIAGVSLKRTMMQTFRDTNATFVLVFAGVLTLFSLLITTGVLFNAARISFAERQRELATLRVIGMTRHETWLVLAGELAIQLLLAVPMGLLLGTGLIVILVKLMGSDLFRMPMVVYPSTFALAVLLVAAGGIAFILLVRRWIGGLDMVGALKTRE